MPVKNYYKGSEIIVFVPIGWFLLTSIAIDILCLVYSSLYAYNKLSYKISFVSKVKILTHSDINMLMSQPIYNKKHINFQFKSLMF